MLQNVREPLNTHSPNMTAPGSNASANALATPAGSPFFSYRKGALYAEGVSLAELGRALGTPLYVYSKAALAAAWSSYQEAIGAHRVLVCYGMKANSNLAVLK